MTNQFKIAKLPLCSLIAASALVGSLLALQRLEWAAAQIFLALLCLACGAATLNSFQESAGDRFLQRTCNRPLARGLIDRKQALLQARILLVIGFVLLYIASSSTPPVFLAASAVVLYNFVYTPLKYRSVWAVLPGALCGALPPYIGWVSVGGSGVSPVILTVAAFLVTWQIPHFWLIVLKNRDDYRHSAMPSVIKVLSEKTLRSISMVWIVAMVAIVHILVIQLSHLPEVVRSLISLCSILLLGMFGVHMWALKRPDYRFLFIVINSFMFFVLLFLSVGTLWVDS